MAEAGGGEQLFHPVQQQDVVPLSGDDHHGRPLKQVGLAVGKAGVLGARHGVAAHKGEAVLLRQGEAHPADLPLHAAAVHDQGVLGNIGGHLLQVVDGDLGIQCHQKQVAVSDRFPIQISGQGALELGVILDHPVSVIAVYRGSALFIRFGQGTTDQSQARNADLHIQHPSCQSSARAAACTRRTALATSSNCSGRRDWAPSHRAWGGSLCTSMIRPSAPQAAAARAIGLT